MLSHVSLELPELFTSVPTFEGFAFVLLFGKSVSIFSSDLPSRFLTSAKIHTFLDFFFLSFKYFFQKNVLLWRILNIHKVARRVYWTFIYPSASSYSAIVISYELMSNFKDPFRK